MLASSQTRVDSNSPLRSSAGLGEKTMRVIVTRFLPIYGLSLNGNVRESVERIRAALGLEAGEFRKVMERHPGERAKERDRVRRRANIIIIILLTLALHLLQASSY